MATNPVGTGKVVVSASVPVEIAETIAKRASLLGWSKSKYASELLIRWYRDGCPSLSSLDQVAESLAAEDPGNYGEKNGSTPTQN